MFFMLWICKQISLSTRRIRRSILIQCYWIVANQWLYCCWWSLNRSRFYSRKWGNGFCFSSWLNSFLQVDLQALVKYTDNSDIYCFQARWVRGYRSNGNDFCPFCFLKTIFHQWCFHPRIRRQLDSVNHKHLTFICIGSQFQSLHKSVGQLQ